jgi:hypothetical protein
MMRLALLLLLLLAGCIEVVDLQPPPDAGHYDDAAVTTFDASPALPDAGI